MCVCVLCVCALDDNMSQLIGREILQPLPVTIATGNNGEDDESYGREAVSESFQDIPSALGQASGSHHQQQQQLPREAGDSSPGHGHDPTSSSSQHHHHHSHNDYMDMGFVRKEKEAARRGKREGGGARGSPVIPTSPHSTQFIPGGILETRIGAVGRARGNAGGSQTDPPPSPGEFSAELSAKMY